MLDSIEPYDIHFIQKASPTSNGDAFDFSYIYKFRTERTVKYQSLKYIIRVEAIGDLFAIKFYAARDGKLDNKYNLLFKHITIHKHYVSFWLVQVLSLWYCLTIHLLRLLSMVRRP